MRRPTCAGSCRPSRSTGRGREHRGAARPTAGVRARRIPAQISTRALDVRRALQELAPRERACIVLRYFDDLTVPQIAASLGIAEGTVKRYLADASGKLARPLTVETIDEPKRCGCRRAGEGAVMNTLGDALKDAYASMSPEARGAARARDPAPSWRFADAARRERPAPEPPRRWRSARSARCGGLRPGGGLATPRCPTPSGTCGDILYLPPNPAALG